MNKLGILGIGLILLASLVFAITLTAEATEKVEVPAAFKTQVCDENDSTNCKELIFGVAYAFPKGSTTIDQASEMLVFEMDNIIYRTTGTLFEYYANTPGDSDYTTDPATITGVIIKGMSGRSNLSAVNNDGTETDSDAEYKVDLSYSNGRIGNELKNLEFKINEIKYILSEILDQSSFTWIPGTGIVEATP
ncbi:MAG: hypothetical protein Q7S92_00565 [Candidatus Diapherotrites archaeon]|nr:hypothetical protein [Candidatus Diapherotrites archaeon]